MKLSEGLLIGCQFLLVVSDDVHHIQLEILLVEQQVLVLGMDVDQSFSEFLQHSQLYGCIIDERATFSCRRQFPSDDTVCRIIFDIVLLEEILHTVAREVELRFDHTFLSTLLDGFRVSPLTQ